MKRSKQLPARADPRARRRHGHHDPARAPRRGGVPRRALPRLARATCAATTTCSSLTQPELIRDIHAQYLEAGADIIETNTFNSTSISLADYGLEDARARAELAAARLAREAARRSGSATPEQPRFVAGVLGPDQPTASISPDVNDPGFRAVTLRRAGRGLRRGARAACSKAASTCCWSRRSSTR